MSVLQPVNKIAKYCLPGLLFALAGCETPPSVVEQNFGSSVRNTIALQTAQPGQQTPALDGVKGEAVLRGYQADVASQKTAERELIQINVGK